MTSATSVILFEAAVNYANETSDVSIRSDLRMAFVAGAEWQWNRLAAKDAEIAKLREALRPFSESWETVISNGDRLRNLSLGQLGALASHEVSGVHFQRASAALAGGSDAS